MPYVGSEGPLDAKIVFIGEAWGTNEAQQKRPFVGSSGQLLTKIMNGAGIARSEVYITNVVKAQPPGNNIEHYIKFNNYGQAQPTQAYTEFENILYEELSLTNANVYVAVGNVPLYALCRKTAITKRRGSILRGKIGGREVKVIPIIHPASAMRQYIYTHFISFDMRRIAYESKYPDLRYPIRNLALNPTYYDVMAFLQHTSTMDRVAFDIEVMNEEVSCISFAISPHEAMSIPFTTHGRDFFTVEQEMEIWKEIAFILEDVNIIKVGQNLVFDSAFLLSKLGIKVRNTEDTMIAQGVTYPDFPKGLDFLCSIYTREPYYKDDGKKWMKMGGPEEDFWAYNAKDSAVCMEIIDAMYTEMEKMGTTQTYKRQALLIEPLVYMAERGTKIDTAVKRELSVEYGGEDGEGGRIGELTAELRNICGYSINPNSTKQLQEYFYIKKGIKPYISRSTGSITTDETALKRISAKGYKEADIVLRIRHLSKMRSTYLEMKIDKDDRLRCSFNPVGTKTGRLSSGQTIFDTGGNMQNLPPDMLRLLKADEGYLIYNIDLSQAENRIVAYIAPEPNMIAAFEKGVDIHRQTGGLITGKPAEEVSDEPGSSRIGGGVYSERFWGKKCNHSLNYDLGYKSFSLLCEIPEVEGRALVERYHSVYPGVRQYHSWVRAKLSKDRQLENPLGRRRVFLDRWGDELFKEAYAWTPQSTVADIINERGLIYIYYNQQWFSPVELLNQVHDSIWFQMSYITYTAQQHAECLLRLRDSLQTPIRWRGTEFTIPADLKVGINLDKKAMREVKLNEFTDTGGLAIKLSGIIDQYRTALPL